MIEITQGNLLTAPVDALVNTVNTEGAMGKGIALQFKQAYPQMFQAYEKACKAGEVRLGKMHVFDLGGIGGGPRWIINFPTKRHWRAASRLEDIGAGLRDLAVTVRRLQIGSIAVPPLGCGHGGLDWNEVRPAIERALGPLTDVRVLLYAPVGTPEAGAMPNRTKRPKMTIGQAAMIALMNRYLAGLLDPCITLLELHKLMYFMQEVGQPLRLQYEANVYGPYAKNLRHVLVRLESHYTQGYGEGDDKPTKTIELLPGAIEEAEKFLAQDRETSARIDRVVALMRGYEDPFGLELLSSVHWLMKHDSVVRTDVEAAVLAVLHWSDRKGKLFKPEHVEMAWQRLKEEGWDKDEDCSNVQKSFGQ